MQDELKPCPCGGKTFDRNSYAHECFYVSCDKCDFIAEGQTKEKAIKAWNTREAPGRRLDERQLLNLFQDLILYEQGIGWKLRSDISPGALAGLIHDTFSAPAVDAKEIVICAAIKYKDGLIIRGHRHGDCAFDCDRPLKKDFKGHIQGFITSKNRFVTREEGRKLQDAAGIKSVDGYRGDTLFSEDLY